MASLLQIGKITVKMTVKVPLRISFEPRHTPIGECLFQFLHLLSSSAEALLEKLDVHIAI